MTDNVQASRDPHWCSRPSGHLGHRHYGQTGVINGRYAKLSAGAVQVGDMSAGIEVQIQIGDDEATATLDPDQAKRHIDHVVRALYLVAPPNGSVITRAVDVIRAFGGDELDREQAATLLHLWRSLAEVDVDELRRILEHFPPATASVR